jgi:subtilisin-like proprotein convertase family protein/BarA-like signal transduction histidine kinase
VSFRARLLRQCSAAALSLLLAALFAHTSLLGQIAPPRSPGKASNATGNFDVRISPQLKADTLRRLGRGSVNETLARVRSASDAVAKLRADLPGVTVTLSAATGGAEVVRNPRGALTAPLGGDSRAIVSGFLQANAGIYGLAPGDVATVQFRGESVSRGSGLRMLRAEQVINGIPVFQSDARFILDRQGRLIRTLGAFTAVDAATSAGTSAAISSSEALVAAMQSVGITIVTSAITPAIEGTKERLTVNSPHISGPVTSNLVYFPIAPGVVTLAYEQFTFTDGTGDYLTVVDASNGALLWRKNSRAYQTLPTQEARFSVYVQADGRTPADSPAPMSPTTAVSGGGTQFPEIARTIVKMSVAQDPIASPAGWLADGVTTTTGNNVDACEDRVGGANANICDTGTIDNNGRPIGNPDTATNNRDFLGNAVRDFNYFPSPQGGNPEAGDNATGTGTAQVVFRRGAITQLFYVTNWYHDQLFNLGFDEAAGNFQTTNFSGQGAGGDPVRAENQDSSGTNNSNFSTPPDGSSGRMQMFIFDGPTVDRDGSLDAEVVMHELTHGTSNRLVGNGTGLQWNPGGGMGEGWSDFYALSLLNNTNADDPDGEYAMGAYATYRLVGSGFTDNYVSGIRRFPYSTNNAINPLTWADVDDVTRNYAGGIPISSLGFEQGGGFEVHNVGEVWALTLWEIRSRVIHDPAGANGDVPTGNHTMLQLVTDALKLTPAQPSFIDARDALIDADCATNACANERWIWEGFADRGLGFGASAPLTNTGFSFQADHMSLSTSFEMPKLNVASFSIDDSLGNHNGTIDPGEAIKIGVELANPYRSAVFNVPNATATLTTTTPGVTILTGTTTFGAIAAQSSAVGSTLKFRLNQTPTCGSAIDFTLTVTSALGTTSSTFMVRVGVPSGTGAPITYTKTESPGLAIPDAAPLGVLSSLTISDDFEIAHLDFRMDNLTHTFTGDITALLRSPTGYGNDLIWFPGVFSSGGSSGDNFVNTVISDQSANDLGTVANTAAPYTGDWMPAFNSPVWNTLGPGVEPDPVGNLSRHNGTRTKGTWTVQVSDAVAVDTGTLNSWSLIVTPTDFTCSPFVDTTPPVTTVNFTPPAPSGDDGWYTTPFVRAAVSAFDNPGAVVETRCVLDPASAPATFANLPASCGYAGAGNTVSAEGLHVLYAASIDGNDNAETPVIAAFKIDHTPPIVTCATPAPTFVFHQANATVTGTVTDAVSGAAAGLVFATADTSTAGAKTVSLTGRDNAGNTASVSCPYTVGTAPTVTITAPTTDPTVNATSPFLALAGTASDVDGVTGVTWTNDRGGSGTASGTTAWTIAAVPLQTGTNVITVTATNVGGGTSTDTLTVSFNALTYFLAEGSTGSFFTMDVALANPNSSAAHITVTFLKADGTTVIQDRTLPATSRTTIRVNDIAGLEGTPVSVIVSSLDLLPLGVERTMSWDSTSYGGHGETAVTQPRLKWYFAEGSQGFFHTYILVLNPNAAATTATVTFLPETGVPVVRTYPMAALSRVVVDGASIPELANRSFGFTVEATQPIVVERSMYFGDTPTRIFAGGHASAGAPDPSLSWYFAEGATGAFFDTYILLGNPGATPANVTLTYLLDSGITVTGHKTVAPNSRLTVGVEGEDAQLANAAFSTQVASDVPIIAERSMYWVGDPLPWTEGHNSVGVTAPGTKWLLAEGRVGGSLGYQTYILLGNPSTTTAANVTITYLKTDGSVVTKNYVVAPTSRYNVFVNGVVPELQDESFGATIAVTNSVQIFVERSLYWNSGGIVWAGGTNATATRLP